MISTITFSNRKMMNVSRRMFIIAIILRWNITSILSLNSFKIMIFIDHCPLDYYKIIELYFASKIRK